MAKFSLKEIVKIATVCLPTVFIYTSYVIAESNFNSSLLVGEWSESGQCKTSRQVFTADGYFRRIENQRGTWITRFQGVYRVKSNNMVAVAENTATSDVTIQISRLTQTSLSGQWRDVGSDGRGSINYTRCSINPTPFPAERLGSLEYYEFRERDFKNRNPSRQPPDYYLKFGDYYLRKFRQEIRPKLTKQGQEFIDRVGVALQKRMENELRSNPMDFAELEKSSDKFREFAYKTHVAAYCESGWGDLPLSDNKVIAASVRPKDLWRGKATSFSISSKCGWLRDALNSLPVP
jgi:hypothetical protein